MVEIRSYATKNNLKASRTFISSGDKKTPSSKAASVFQKRQ
jgi:hypothetical protein